MIINIDPVAFYIPVPVVGWWPVYWYGISWLVAILGVNFAAKRLGKVSRRLSPAQAEDYLTYGILGAILGGRIGYMVFYAPDQLIYDPLSIIRIWEGGLSFHGGLIGVLFSFYLFGRKFSLKFSDVMEHYAICFPIGLGSVRVGNFMGGELLGRPTEVSWGVIFSNDPEGLLRHPSQLYQAFSEGFILFILLYLFAQTNPPRWSIAGLFLSGYAVVRIFTENFRTPDAHIGFDLLEIFTRGQLLSLPMLIIGISLMIFAYRKKPS
tara:strand:+ start:620 stop:1414 length:795 start_codon:yes stop_codon:yes gene_type:complete